MKKIKWFTVIVIVMSMLCINVFGESPTRIKINGTDLNLTVQPVIVNGRTLVPLRAIFEALNVSPEWDNVTKTVTAKTGTVDMNLKIGSNTALVNNKLVNLEVPGTLVNGSTMVPARFIAETFGGVVGWDEATRTVLITSADKQIGSASPLVPAQTEAVQKTIQGNAYKHMLGFMNQFENSQFNNVVKIGNIPSYRAELSEVKIIVHADKNSEAKYDPVSDTITLSTDPANVSGNESLHMGMLVWHELTHKLENGQGDIGVFDSALYAERNIEYMKHIIDVALPKLEMMERDTAADDAKIQKYWKMFEASFDEASKLPESQKYPPDLKKMEQWFGFSVDKAEILKYYQSGQAGERFKTALTAKPAAVWAGSWKSNFGVISMTQSGTSVSGTYTYQSGTINGTVSGNILSGTWAETDDQGTFSFTLSADGKSFGGSWKETSPNPSQGGNWSGTRQ